jgi:hypothetical protein
MVRRLSKLAVVAALLVLVASCTVAYLYSTVDAASAATAQLVAIGAAIVLVVGILARGQGGAALAKARQVIGAVGLFLTPVAAALTLFALVDPPTIPSFVMLTVLALLAWMQGVAAQTGLSLRVTARWFVSLLVFTVVALVVGSVIAAISIGVWKALGLDPTVSGRVAFGLALASIGAVLFAWARGRRDRQALGPAIGRAAFGRANPVDIAYLAAGPGPILRRRSTSEIEPADQHARDVERDARFAAIDATLADPSPADREAPAGDR